MSQEQNNTVVLQDIDLLTNLVGKVMAENNLSMLEFSIISTARKQFKVTILEENLNELFKSIH